MRRELVIAALLACGPVRPRGLESVGNVRLVTDVRDPALASACHVWTDYLHLGCGFEDSGRVECDHDWRRRKQICQLSIGVRFMDSLPVRARSERAFRLVEIDRKTLAGNRLDLLIAVAHELGHVILDTDQHTASGVMAGQDAVLSADDRALADRLGP